MSRIDTGAIAANWLQVCGPCDGGLPTPCACPVGDCRPVISTLLTEVERLYEATPTDFTADQRAEVARVAREVSRIARSHRARGRSSMPISLDDALTLAAIAVVAIGANGDPA